MDWLLYPLAFAVVLGVLIIVHEWGHYAVARHCGVKVLRFSVGFGKPLLKRQGADGTEWVLAAFPLGGYVKMVDEREGDVAQADLPFAFNRQSLIKRSAIVAAGPVANFVLAFFIYWFCFWQGSMELVPLLGEPVAGSPAAEAQIFAGDRVKRIEGEPIRSWQELRWVLLAKAVDKPVLEVETEDAQGQVHVHRLNTQVIAEKSWEGDPVELLGLKFFRPSLPAVVGKLVPGGPAEMAGMLQGDEILAIGEAAVKDWQDMVAKVREMDGAPATFLVRRENQQLQISISPSVVPENGRAVGKIGVGVAVPIGLPPMREWVRYPFGESALKAMGEVWEKSAFSLTMLGKMLTGEVSWKNLSGPVTIADYAGQSAKMGWDVYLKFMALVSVSLGVLNLLPIPVLDGGHLMYYIAEAINGGPLPDKVMEWGQRIGLALMLTLMAFAFFNDINRLFSG